MSFWITRLVCKLWIRVDFQYMKIQTEFTTVSSAYKNLRDRIDELEKRIAELPNYEAVAPTITCLYYN